MQTIQLAISDRSYSTALREALLRDGSWDVRCVETPDPALEGVIVLDRFSLESVHMPAVDPERVVLITPNRPEDLSRAWEAGIVSLVFDSDPVHTAMLAVMAASMRIAKDVRKPLKTSAPAEPDRGKMPAVSLEEPGTGPKSGRAHSGGKRPGLDVV